MKPYHWSFATTFLLTWSSVAFCADRNALQQQLDSKLSEIRLEKVALTDLIDSCATRPM